jgi:hypothetical protein
MRPVWLVTVLGVGLLLPGPVVGGAAPASVSAIWAGAHEGRLQVEIRATAPLSYLLVEEPDPFRVSLLLLNATFQFPAQEREVRGPGLARIRTSLLEREGSHLGRLDLTFRGSVVYHVVREGTRLLVRVEAPPPEEALLLAGTAVEAPRPPPPAAAPATRAQPAPVPLILKLMPETGQEGARVVVEADGPLRYRGYTLQNPARVVVDFEGARLSPKEDSVEVGDTVLRRVRSSQFSPGVVRVVLDLARPAPFWIEPREEGVVIHLREAPRR